MYDVIIIGAGIIGTSIARALSKYKLKVAIIEKENDVSQGTTKANSAIVHGGYDAKCGTKKGYYSRKGNRLFHQLNKELNFGFEECGSLVLAFSDEDTASLEHLKANGEKNGVDDLVILDGDTVKGMEPNVSDSVIGALYCPSAGICSPYEMAIAMAENAITNGVDLYLKTAVTGISKVDSHFIVSTNQEDYSGKYVINCAGVHADTINNMINTPSFYIIPRRGEYILLNKNQGHLANRVLFQAPTKAGKGILVTKTFHGNLMLGPNAQEVSAKEDVGTSIDALRDIVTKARKSVPSFDLKYAIRTFSGIRATANIHDFIVEESKTKGFVNVAGIESPGLTSAPAIALDVVKIVEEAGLSLVEDPSFTPYRRGIIVPKSTYFDGTIDDSDPSKNIICRCEQVTEAEIVDAIHRGIPIDSLDAVKRRTRTNMGPCQGSFCGTRVADIISRETGIKKEHITLRGQGSSSLPKREGRTFWRELE